MSTQKIYLLSEVFYTESQVIKAFLEKPSTEQLTSAIHDHIGSPRVEQLPQRGSTIEEVVETLLSYDYSKDRYSNSSTLHRSVTLHLQLVDLE